MAEIVNKVNCTYCLEKNVVVLSIKQTKNFRTIKVGKCEKCKMQNGIKAVLTDATNE